MQQSVIMKLKTFVHFIPSTNWDFDPLTAWVHAKQFHSFLMIFILQMEAEAMQGFSQPQNG